MFVRRQPSVLPRESHWMQAAPSEAATFSKKTGSYVELGILDSLEARLAKDYFACRACSRVVCSGSRSTAARYCFRGERGDEPDLDKFRKLFPPDRGWRRLS